MLTIVCVQPSGKMMSRREIEDKVKRVINKNYTKIIYKVDPGPLIRRLKETGLLTVAGYDGYYEELSKMLENKTKSVVMERLIDILFHRENWWLPLLKALRENENNEAAEIIESALPKSERMKLNEKPKERRQEKTSRHREKYAQSEDTDSDYEFARNNNLKCRSIRHGSFDYSSDVSSQDSEMEPVRGRMMPSSLQNGPPRMQTRRNDQRGTQQKTRPKVPHPGGNPAYQSYDNDFASYVSRNRENVLPSGFYSLPSRHNDPHGAFSELYPTEQFFQNQVPEIQTSQRSNPAQPRPSSGFRPPQFSEQPEKRYLGFQKAHGPDDGQETSFEGYSVDLGQPRATRQASPSTLKYSMASNPETRTSVSEGSAVGSATVNLPASEASSVGHPSGSSEALPAVIPSREHDMQRTSLQQNDFPLANPSPISNTLPSNNFAPTELKTSVVDQKSSRDNGTTDQSGPPLISPPPPPPPPPPATAPPPPVAEACAAEEKPLLTLDTSVPQLPAVIITHLEKMNFDGWWKNFLRELSNKITFDDENRIASNYESKARQVIQLFYHYEGKKATFGKIMAALRKIKRQDVMDGIKASTGFVMEEESDSDTATSVANNPAYLDFSSPSLAPIHEQVFEESNSPTNSVEPTDCPEASKTCPLQPTDSDKDPKDCPSDTKDCPQAAAEAKPSPEHRKSKSLETEQKQSLNSNSLSTTEIKQNVCTEKTDSFQSPIGGRITSIQGEKENRIHENKRSQCPQNLKLTSPQREGYAEVQEALSESPESDTSDSNNLHINTSEEENTNLDDSVMANMNISNTKKSPKIKNIEEVDTSCKTQNMDVSSGSDSSMSMGSYIPLSSVERNQVNPQITTKPAPVRMQQPVTQVLPPYSVQPLSVHPPVSSYSYGSSYYPAMPLQPHNAQMVLRQPLILQQYPLPPGPPNASSMSSVSSGMLYLQPSNPQMGNPGNSVYWPPNTSQVSHTNPSQTIVQDDKGNQFILSSSKSAGGNASGSSHLVDSSNVRRTDQLRISEENPDLRMNSTGTLYLGSVSLSDSMSDDRRQVIEQCCDRSSSVTSSLSQVHQELAETALKDKISGATKREDHQDSEDDGEDDDEEDDDDGDDEDEDGDSDEADGEKGKDEDRFEDQTLSKQTEESIDEETFLKQPYKGPVSDPTSAGTAKDEQVCKDHNTSKDVRQEELKMTTPASSIAAPNSASTKEDRSKFYHRSLPAVERSQEAPELSKVEQTNASQTPEVEHPDQSPRATSLDAEQSLNDAEQSEDAEVPVDAIDGGSSSRTKTVFKSVVKLYEMFSLGTGDNTVQRWHSN